MRHCLASIVLLLASTSALAEFNYSYFELGYMPRTYYEGDYADGQDLRVRFLAGYSLFFSGYAAGSEARDEGRGVFFQNETYGVGFGWHAEISEKLSGFITAGYEHMALKSGVNPNTRVRVNDDGWGAEVGFRFKPIEKPLELALEYDYDAYDDNDARFFEVSAHYPFWDRYGVTLSYANGEYLFTNPGLPDTLGREDIRIALRVYW